MSDDIVVPPAAQPPLLQVVRGEPTDAEIAAVTAVLLTRSASAPTHAPSRRSPWSEGAGVRRPLPAPGADSWRVLGRR